MNATGFRVFNPDSSSTKRLSGYSFKDLKTGNQIGPMADPFYPLHVNLTPLSLSQSPADIQNHYSLRNGSGYRVDADWGTAILSKLVVNGFIFSYNEFYIHRPLELSFSCETDSGILHYVTKGNIHLLRSDKTIENKMDKSQYHLGYHPKGKEQPVYFQTGEHHYFQLIFSPILLQHLLTSLKKPLSWNPENATAKVPFFLPQLPVTKRLSSLITGSMKLMTLPVKDLLRLNDLGLQITARFITDANTMAQRQYWEQKKQLKLGDLEAYIIDHLDTEHKVLLTTMACAKKTGMGTYHFKILFYRQFGQTLAEFIRKKRMEKAMQLLTGSSQPAGDIYLQVGYENFSSFTRSFTAYYGNPPSHFRKN